MRKVSEYPLVQPPVYVVWKLESLMKKLIDPSPARAAAYVALYPMLHAIAKRHGYALTIHGSLHRDFDLVAIPWVEKASRPLTLIKAIKEATRTVTQHEDTDHLLPDCRPTKKPHGRVAYSLHVTRHGMYGGYLDISVMPTTK
jgi:hypothetical protein